MSLDLEQHLLRQIAFSRATFGPGTRKKGVIEHIRKELVEVEGEMDPILTSREWADVVILGLDGMWRSMVFGRDMDHGEAAEMVVRTLLSKQERNERREWPDWRTADPNKAIEHVRGKE